MRNSDHLGVLVQWLSVLGEKSPTPWSPTRCLPCDNNFPEPREFDLAEQLRECALGFEQVWDEKGIDLQMDVPDELAVRSDEEPLSLVWNNLLSNAFKFTEPGARCSSPRARRLIS